MKKPVDDFTAEQEYALEKDIRRASGCLKKLLNITKNDVRIFKAGVQSKSEIVQSILRDEGVAGGRGSSRIAKNFATVW